MESLPYRIHTDCRMDFDYVRFFLVTAQVGLAP